MPDIKALVSAEQKPLLTSRFRARYNGENAQYIVGEYYCIEAEQGEYIHVISVRSEGKAELKYPTIGALFKCWREIDFLKD